jgi:hypothetical protein
MAWCRREALRLTHHVRLALGSPALVAGKVRDRPPPWDSSDPSWHAASPDYSC